MTRRELDKTVMPWGWRRWLHSALIAIVLACQAWPATAADNTGGFRAGLAPHTAPQSNDLKHEGNGIYILIEDDRLVGNLSFPETMNCSVDIAAFNLTTEDIAELVIIFFYTGKNGDIGSSLSRFRNLRADVSQIDLLNNSHVQECHGLKVTAKVLSCVTFDKHDCSEYVKGITNRNSKSINIM
jgi:hypothetical protein